MTLHLQSAGLPLVRLTARLEDPEMVDGSNNSLVLYPHWDGMMLLYSILQMKVEGNWWM